MTQASCWFNETNPLCRWVSLRGQHPAEAPILQIHSRRRSVCGRLQWEAAIPSGDRRRHWSTDDPSQPGALFGGTSKSVSVPHWRSQQPEYTWRAHLDLCQPEYTWWVHVDLCQPEYTWWVHVDLWQPEYTWWLHVGLWQPEYTWWVRLHLCQPEYTWWVHLHLCQPEYKCTFVSARVHLMGTSTSVSAIVNLMGTSTSVSVRVHLMDTSTSVSARVHMVGMSRSVSARVHLGTSCVFLCHRCYIDTYLSFTSGCLLVSFCVTGVTLTLVMRF